MKTHIEFKYDETNGGDDNEQLAGAAAWIADRNGDPTHYVEYHIVPENEFYIYAREWAQDNNNPEPTDAMIAHEIEQNYHTVDMDGELYVLVPQI